MTDASTRMAELPIAYNAEGLVPAIAQQHDTGEVLMMAWMNAQSVAESLATGQVCYWSRSRQALWRKGETSGQRQRLVELRIDCDGDTLLLLVDQTGAACHTGQRSCFYRAVQDVGVVELSRPIADPAILYANADSAILYANADPAILYPNADPAILYANADPAMLHRHADPAVLYGQADPAVRNE